MSDITARITVIDHSLSNAPSQITERYSLEFRMAEHVNVPIRVKAKSFVDLSSVLGDSKILFVSAFSEDMFVLKFKGSLQSISGKMVSMATEKDGYGSAIIQNEGDSDIQVDASIIISKEER